MEEKIVCPECHGDQLTAGKKGFDPYHAAAGYLVGGVALGLGAGALHSDEVVITCLKCGNRFPAGSGAVRVTDDNGHTRIISQDQAKQSAGEEKAVAVTIAAVLVAFGLLAWWILAG